jgi:hypothetical protein
MEVVRYYSFLISLQIYKSLHKNDKLESLKQRLKIYINRNLNGYVDGCSGGKWMDGWLVGLKEEA